MNYDDAVKTASMFREIGGFSEIRVDHRGFYSQRTPALENDGKWTVELWSVNARAGNRNLFVVEHLPTEKEAKLLAKKAKGQATERDNQALSRMAAEREVNRE